MVEALRLRLALLSGSEPPSRREPWRAVEAPDLTGGQGVAGSNPVSPTQSFRRSEALFRNPGGCLWSCLRPGCSSGCSSPVRPLTGPQAPHPTRSPQSTSPPALARWVGVWGVSYSVSTLWECRNGAITHPPQSRGVDSTRPPCYHVHMASDIRKQVLLRLDPDLLTQVDQRIEAVNTAKPDLRLSRNEWFENMARWVIERLPHEAIRSDLVAAWPHAPHDLLGTDPPEPATAKTEPQGRDRTGAE